MKYTDPQEIPTTGKNINNYYYFQQPLIAQKNLWNSLL